MSKDLKTPREIVIDSLNHKETYRVPVDLGGQSNSTLTLKALNNLNQYLNSTKEESSFTLMAKHFQSVGVPENILLRYKIDFRSVNPGKPKNKKEVSSPDGSYLDDWGIKYSPSGRGLYFDISEYPLINYEEGSIDNFDWLDPDDEGWTAGLKDKVENYYFNTDFAIIGNMTSAQIFERCWNLRGFEPFLMDLYVNKSFAHKLLDKVTNIQIQRVKNFLKICGKYLSIFKISDDLCGQTAPFISPQSYTEMIMPYHKKYIEEIKKFTDAKVALHCCGNIRPLLPKLIEVGFDVVHPFQFSCPEMNPSVLKKEFGKDLVFWGGVDVQKFLPNATPKEVASEVKRIIDIMHIGGGYIFSPSHNIQADIPPKNLEAMYNTAAIINFN
ncbi:MAG: uroporphyrinogen decarboxylase family protein [Candidatus Humimicrobiaceae bacterium]